MKKLLSLLLLSGLPLAAAQAQFSHFHGTLGLGTVMLRSTAPEAGYPDPNIITYGDNTSVYRLKTVDKNLVHMLGNVGVELPIIKLSNEQAFGVSLNARAGLLGAPEEADGFNARLLLDFPQYVTWRYGAWTTKRSEKTFGVALGAGYRWAKFFIPFNAPSVMIEGVYDTSGGIWSLRLSGDVKKMQFYNYYSSEGYVPVMSLRQLNLTLGKAF
jgi:hypothetical protein